MASPNPGRPWSYSAVRRQPPPLPAIPEFENVHLDDEGIWRATHITTRYSAARSRQAPG
jgi:hypothetical protein